MEKITALFGIVIIVSLIIYGIIKVLKAIKNQIK